MMLGLGLSLLQSSCNTFDAVQWWQEGATMSIDFTNNRAMKDGSSIAITNLLTCTRATTGTAKDIAGNDVAFGINELRITDKGLFIHAIDGATAADDVIFSDISWLDSSLGTWVIEWEQLAVSADMQLLLRWFNAGGQYGRVRTGSSAAAQVYDDAGTLILNTGQWSSVNVGVHKVGLALAANNIAFARSASLDGLTGTDVAGIPLTNAIELSLGGNSGNVSNEALNGFIRKITYFPTRLSNAELQALVT